MSMRDYAYVDYGLVLDEETVKRIYEKVFGREPENLADMEFELFDKGIIEYISEFTGEAMRLYDDGTDDWRDSITYSADVCYYVAIEKYPSLFKANYKDMDEIIDEIKSRVGEYMPEGYDYRVNICHIIGTTFG